MTTVEIFKNHPNKKNIKFVVYPLAKESAHLCNDFMKCPFKKQINEYFMFQIKLITFSDPKNIHGLKF
jgi:hypothetical protein